MIKKVKNPKNPYEESKMYSFDLFGTLIGPENVYKKSIFRDLSFLLARIANRHVLYKPDNRSNLKTFTYKKWVDIYHELISQNEIVVIVSNTHLSLESVHKLLKTHQVELPDKIYLSSEYLTSKKYNLFEYVKKDFQSEKWLHYGDDDFLDQMSENFGAEYYPVVNGKSQLLQMGVISRRQSKLLLPTSVFQFEFIDYIENTNWGEKELWESIGAIYSFLGSVLFFQKIETMSRTEVDFWILIGRDMTFVSEMLGMYQKNNYQLVNLRRDEIENKESSNWLNILKTIKEKKSDNQSIGVADISFKRSLAKAILNHSLDFNFELYLLKTRNNNVGSKSRFVLSNNSIFGIGNWSSFREIWEIVLCAASKVEKNITPHDVLLARGFSDTCKTLGTSLSKVSIADLHAIQRLFKTLVSRPSYKQMKVFGSFLHDASGAQFQSIDMLVEIASLESYTGRSYWRRATMLGIMKKDNGFQLNRLYLFVRWFRSETRYYIRKFS